MDIFLPRKPLKIGGLEIKSRGKNSSCTDIVRG